MEPMQPPLCLCRPCPEIYERSGFTKKLPEVRFRHVRPSRPPGRQRQPKSRIPRVSARGSLSQLLGLPRAPAPHQEPSQQLQHGELPVFPRQTHTSQAAATSSLARARADGSPAASAPGNVQGTSRRAEGPCWDKREKGEWWQTELRGNRPSHGAAQLESRRSKTNPVPPPVMERAGGTAGAALASELPHH